MPYIASLVTSDFPHKAEWSESNLPDVLFYIELPKFEKECIKVADLIENGETVISDGPVPRNIREFDILPRNISLDVPGWLIEAWRRLDTRISYRDILDRQQSDPELGLKKLTKNALQNHCRRECRKVLNAWVEYGRRDEPHRTEVEAIEGLSYENIMYNTTLNRCESMPNRLIKVRLERRHEDGLFYAIPFKVTEDNWRETTLPLDHFLANEHTMKMTTGMLAAFEMYLILMERARSHGHWHWSKLERNCLPITWYDRTKTKSLPNDTYDGGCTTCTWSLEKTISPGPLIKIETGVTPSPAKSGQKRRRGSSTGLWDLGDTPKRPKSRQVTRLALLEESDDQDDACDSSPETSNVIYEETYKRRAGSEERYRVGEDGEIMVAANGGHLSDSESEDSDDDHSETEDGDDDEDDEVATSDEDPEDGNARMVEGMIPHDPFGPRPIFFSNQLNDQHRDPDFERYSATSSPSYQSYRSIGGSLDTVVPAQGLVENSEYAAALYPSSADAVAMIQNLASGYYSHDSSLSSASAQSGVSFSSNEAYTSTATSSFSHDPETGFAQYQDQSVSRPTDTTYPIPSIFRLPMAQGYAAAHDDPYPSPPHTGNYQDQMYFNSSPPRPSEDDFGLPQNRSRRRSDTDVNGRYGLYEHGNTTLVDFQSELFLESTRRAYPNFPAINYGNSLPQGRGVIEHEGDGDIAFDDYLHNESAEEGKADVAADLPTPQSIAAP